MNEDLQPKNPKSRATIADVARAAGVSKTTISRFLSKQFDSISASTLKRIEETIAELNYRPNRMARGLKQDRSYLIGFVVADITNPYATSIMRGAEEVCEKHGYNLLVCNTDKDPEKERRYFDLLQTHRIDGLLINTTGYNNSILQEMSKDDMPIVLVDRKVPELDFDMVGTDNRKATGEALTHLLACGYERIAFFSEMIGITSPRYERAEVFRSILRERGHASADDFFEVDMKDTNALESSLDRYLESSTGQYRAVFAGNAVVLLKLVGALKQRNLQIPDDVSLIGFDDPEWAPYVDPGITTISQPTFDIGAAAMEQMLKRINGDTSPPQTMELPASLLIRRSTIAK
ncbi:LacI family DNA-binding transcriptional regulator [Paenibacillus abyssi]|uniref:HTH-type transcriptional regulator KdgR n=1 Tax=Paenibacillus abyssi TaxID=1340531 RepID=A0A917FSC9_9BACL|nr:LacI family DNA-binding transcriptional regulator [Paenibacillus abyssi]GGG03910.1 HTH-type transcriptional regulator KdgR [Paenibacillus abyssi]